MCRGVYPKLRVACRCFEVHNILVVVDKLVGEALVRFEKEDDTDSDKLCLPDLFVVRVSNLQS